MMSKPDKKKVAVHVSTYEALTEFSRLNGLKPCSVIATLFDVISTNDTLSAKLIDLSKQREFDETR